MRRLALLAVLAAAALLAGLARARRWNDLSFHACLLCGLVGASWSSRMHSGGYDNECTGRVLIVGIRLELPPHHAFMGTRESQRTGPVAASGKRAQVA